MTTRRPLLALLLSAAALPAGALPQGGERPLSGALVTFESGGAKDARHARLVALYVPEGQPPSPFLPPGPFTATWEGTLAVDIGTDCVFTAEGRGSVRLSINGADVLEARGPDLAAAEGKGAFLKKGKNRLSVRYASPEKGDAAFRLFWASTDFAREPVPPVALGHDPAAPALVQGRRLREGREIVASRRCLRCHEDPAKGMPELEMDAPSLLDAGARLHTAWLNQWILSPRALRPEATMPKIPGITPQDAADISAYLATLGKEAPAPPPAAPETIAEGGKLFADMRCIGCHTLPDRQPAPDRIPLRYVKAKWKPAALEAFLRAPDRHYAWIEMPDFRLSPPEASKLAAFLLSRPQEEIGPCRLAPDPERGRERVARLGCANCHALPDGRKTAAGAFRGVKGAACRAADFGFTDAQRGALEAFLATDRASLWREAPPEFAARQLKAVRCIACHKRDENADLWSELSGETAALLPKKKDDEEEAAATIEPVVPSLSWIGEKLKPEWSAAFMAGEVEAEMRPWLRPLRMPVFRSRAKLLALGFALEHGYAPSSPPEPEPDPELAPVGRQLAGAQGGFDCLSCHGIGPKAATKVFEAPAPNFMYARDRLRKDYYHRWVREPLRLEPGTKMPQFAPNGRSQLVEILDGDGARQFEALWQYLLAGRKIRPPEN